ncbi:pteridine reductase [Thiofilum flexile]|uniref:pteridine reductase n=1 Tax=Thiofilum flexile TaxID=125627 RepID=UPI00036EB10A|nr:pteridine reductase [Thiofilum flexile]
MGADTLQGKTVLLTGAAKRIGAVTARFLHAQGATVIIHYHQAESEAQQLAQELNAKRPLSCALVQGDLLVTESLKDIVTQAVAHTGCLDVLINNASTYYATPLESLTLTQWHDLLGVNLTAPIFLAQAVAPYLKQTQGCIVNMVDIHGMRPHSGYIAYGVAKAGLVMATQLLARELGAEIRVNGVAPGAILWPEQGVSAEHQEHTLSRTALKRAGTPEDIAKAISFLIQDAHYITGQIIAVEGGRLLNY